MLRGGARGIPVISSCLLIINLVPGANLLLGDFVFVFFLSSSYAEDGGTMAGISVQTLQEQRLLDQNGSCFAGDHLLNRGVEGGKTLVVFVRNFA